MDLSKETLLRIVQMSKDCAAGLWKFIDALPDTQKHELTAMVWYGGDYFFDFNTALQESKRIPPTITSDYLATKTPLHLYLLNALEKVEPIG
ncbi:MAG: hypothetical protein JWQ71_2600 [Pedosphaera sp.]|nr:hypothetical protein [Pedosphaera sp.]